MTDNARMLVVPPYLGEFGWELMNWQGRVRWMVEHRAYQRVVVCAASDRRPLYTRLADDRNVVFCPVPRPAWPGSASEDHRIDESVNRLDPAQLRHVACDAARQSCERYGIDSTDAGFFTPDYRGSLWPTDGAHQSFAELRQASAISTDVLLIPRERSVATERNHPQTWWDDLAARLSESGLTVELYAAPLDHAIRQLSRARLAVGASTGGLHLASLCRCPQYVWGSGAEARWTGLNITNRQRYETVWNPFGTPCRYDECGWQPTVEHVADQTLRTLMEIGLPRGAQTPAWSLKPKWRIKRQLARLLDDKSGFVPWPWTVRRLVREYMV